jgi:hypothetical protein
LSTYTNEGGESLTNKTDIPSLAFSVLAVLECFNNQENGTYNMRDSMRESVSEAAILRTFNNNDFLIKQWKQSRGSGHLSGRIEALLNWVSNSSHCEPTFAKLEKEAEGQQKLRHDAWQKSLKLTSSKQKNENAVE